jgi:hypothetical protein
VDSDRLTGSLKKNPGATNPPCTAPGRSTMKIGEKRTEDRRRDKALIARGEERE